MQEADHILLPLLNGGNALAQIARIEKDRALLLMTRTQTTPDTPTSPLSDPQVIAVICAGLNDLKQSGWMVNGYHPIPRIAPYCDQALTQMDLVDTAVIEAFINAVHGLYPWDGFPDPAFFDRLLRRPEMRPTSARLQREFPAT